jgi:hypothetical protein
VGAAPQSQVPSPCLCSHICSVACVNGRKRCSVEWW